MNFAACFISDAIEVVTKDFFEFALSNLTFLINSANSTVVLGGLLLLLNQSAGNSSVIGRLGVLSSKSATFPVVQAPSLPKSIASRQTRLLRG